MSKLDLIGFGLQIDRYQLLVEGQYQIWSICELNSHINELIEKNCKNLFSIMKSNQYEEYVNIKYLWKYFPNHPNFTFFSVWLPYPKWFSVIHYDAWLKYGFLKKLLHCECTSFQLTISSHQNENGGTHNILKHVIHCKKHAVMYRMFPHSNFDDWKWSTGKRCIRNEVTS